jgi:acyl-CoA synthetase (AMP-forming)/AMP-acid ligase II
MNTPVPIGQTLADSARRSPDHVALWFGDRSWSYAELHDASARVASALGAAGVRAGDRVALFTPNCPELLLGYYGCFVLGAVAVPVNYRYRQPEVQYALEHSGATALIVHESLAGEVEGLPLDAMGVRLRYRIGADRRPGLAAFEELLAGPAGAAPAFGVDQPAAILYTSGTTARPKGVTYTHATLWHDCVIQTETFSFTADDVHLVATAACHAAAFTGQLLPCLYTGGSCVLTHLPRPEEVVRLIAERRVTRTQMLPAMLEDLVEALEARPRGDLRSWKSCTAGGDVVALELHHRFRAVTGFDVTELYGMTEVLSCITTRPFGEKRPGSIGRPASRTQVRVVDDRGGDAAPREVGELLVKSPAMMVGYWNDAKATAEALRDGWMHTGDLARRDEDGWLWFAGRKKEIIVRGGSNISPVEVEAILDEHPAVRLCCVVGAPDRHFGEVVWAFVAPKPEAPPPTEDELRSFVAGRIAAYKVPERILVVDDLPRSPTGKVDRKALHTRVDAEVAGTASS